MRRLFLLFTMLLATKMAFALTPLSVTAAADFPSICNGASDTLRATVTSGTAPYLYTWSPGAQVGSKIKVTPNATTVYTLTVKDATNAITTATVSVTVNSLPAVSLAGGGGYICYGNCAPITFTGTANSMVTYSSNPGGANTVTLNAAGLATVTVCPTVTTNYTATLVTAAVTGCTVTPAANNNIITVQHPLGVVVASGPTTFCNGQSVTLSAANGYTHQWLKNGSPVGANQAFYVATTSGTYTMVESAGVCSVTSSPTTVIVNPVPVVTATNNGFLCANNTLQLTANSVPGGGSYSWNGPNGFSANTAIASIPNAQANATGIYTVHVTVNGCSQNATTNATVRALPVVTATPDTQTCYGTPAGLYASGAAYGSYIWSPADGLSCTNCANPVASPTVTTNYTIIGTDNWGCTGAAVTTLLVINQLPAVNISGNISNCTSGVDSFMASGASLYSWSPADGLSCTTCDNPQASPSVTTTYMLTGTDLLGCSNTATVTLDENKIWGDIMFSAPDTTQMKVYLIWYDPIGYLHHVVDSTVSCMHDTVAHYEFNDAIPGIYFVMAQPLFNTPATVKYLPSYNDTANYWHIAINGQHDANTNNGGMNIAMQQGTVTAGTAAMTGFIKKGVDNYNYDVPATGMLVYLRDSTAAGYHVLGYTYTDTTGHFTFSGLAAGNYNVYPELLDYSTIPFQHIALISGQHDTTIGFKQHTQSLLITPYRIPVAPNSVNNVAESAFGLYPNPAQSDFSIVAPAGVISGTLLVYDMAGKTVMTQELNFNNHTATVHTSLPAGTYMVELLNNKGSRSIQRLVIDK